MDKAGDWAFPAQGAERGAVGNPILLHGVWPRGRRGLPFSVVVLTARSSSGLVLEQA